MFNVEYDVLLDIGYVCGYNFIVMFFVVVFFFVVNYFVKIGMEGCVRFFGIFVEEDGGGKIDLIKVGVYKDIDVCFMGYLGFLGDGWGVVLFCFMVRFSV